MFLLRFLRFLRGYVQFRAEGVFVERFLNLVARDRIPMWNSRRREGVFTAETNAASYRQLRRHAKKTGVKLRILRKSGAPFQRRRFRKRTGLLVGVLLFFGFIYLMSLFIWRIEINGNETVSEQRILETLEEVGVHPGSFRPAIDVSDAERKALLRMDELSWIALNIDGSTLDVQVTEILEKPENMVDPQRPCNIVASGTGRVVSMNVYEGQAMVKVGDPILKGDVIVSGITEDRRGQNMFKHAQAQVMAQVDHTIRVEIPLDQTGYIETGKVVRRYYLSVFQLDLPLFIPTRLQTPYHVERQEKPLVLMGTAMPLGLFQEDYTLMEEVPVHYTEAEAKEKALSQLSIIQNAQLEGAEILERQAVGALQDGVFVLEANIVCIMDVAEEKEIFWGGSSSSDKYFA